MVNYRACIPWQGSQQVGMGADLSAQYPLPRKYLNRPIKFSAFR